MMRDATREMAGAGQAGSLEPALLRRIRSEFCEMPGMTLSVVQASRLFGLPGHTCELMLATLVQQGVLECQGDVFALPGVERAAVRRAQPQARATPSYRDPARVA